MPLDRDLRLDLCRGVALWCIFLDHIPDNVFSWLTLRHYGFSDATEVCMFVSGVTCALSYSGVRRRDGWASVFAHTLLRGWEIYAAFLILTVALAVVVYGSGSDRLADQANVNILLQKPGAALAHAAILMYRPVNTDVLPTFVVFHLSFAPALWGVLKFPNASLLISAFIMRWCNFTAGTCRSGRSISGTLIRSRSSSWSFWGRGGRSGAIEGSGGESLRGLSSHLRQRTSVLVS